MSEEVDDMLQRTKKKLTIF